MTNLVEEEPIVVGLDDTIERRWSPMIDARGIYRDPVCSSRGHFVKTRDLRWLSFTLLTPLPWKTGIKALPFQTLLAPSERYASKRGLRHKKLTDWARQGMLQTIRWLPDRKVIFVGDSSFGTHDLANSISKHGTLISRLRLDANLFELPPETNKRGRPRIKGAPLPKLTSYLNAADECWTKVTPSHWYGAKEKTLEIISGTGLWYRVGTPPTLLRWVLVRDPDGKMEPQAFFCTDTDMDPADVISNFAKRWEMEVTFQEVRTHLGVETQRQWSKKAIARTTPALLGLYSLVCFWAQQALESNQMSYAAAWYKKTNFTFSDAIPVILWKSFYHTLRLTESETKINRAYSNDCYRRFASPYNVQSRAMTLQRNGQKQSITSFRQSTAWFGHLINVTLNRLTCSMATVLQRQTSMLSLPETETATLIF